MLKELEIELQLTIIIGLVHFHRLDQIFDIILCQERASKDSHNFVSTSVQFKSFFDDCNSTIGNDSNINLNPNSIFRISPKGLYPKMTFHPFEENLNNPSVFIKKGYINGSQIEVVRIISEGSLSTAS